MNRAFDYATELAAYLNSTNLGALELRGPEVSLRLVRQGDQFLPFFAPEQAVKPITVSASCVGRFLARHPLQREPVASLGTAVTAGEVIGFLAVGPLLLPVVAPISGIVSAVLARDFATVGFGAPLFELEPLQT